MFDITPFVVAAETVAVLIGAVVTSLAYRAARRTDSVALRTLALGAGFVTLSVVVDGGLGRFLGVGSRFGTVAHSLLLLGGFSALGYSLYVTDPNLSADDDTFPPNRGTGN
ncbi:MAG: hypothetical protein ABEI99_06745 [Halobaculum sp.]